MKYSKQAGVSTVEMLIAFAVVILTLTTVVGVVFGSQSMGVDTETNQEFRILAEGDLEAARAAARSDFLAINSTTGTSTVEGVNITKSLTVTDISPCAKKVTSSISWINEIRNQIVSLFTMLTSATEAQKLGGDCDPFPPGDFEYPDTFGTFDSNAWTASAGIKGTGIDVKTVNGTKYAFLSSLHANKNEPDFWVVDVSDPKNPTYVSSIDVNDGDSWTSGDEGLNDVVVVGEYAYAVRNFDVDQLQVISLANILEPEIVREISFEDFGVATKADKPPGSDPQGEVITYYDGRLYIGLRTTIGPELLVFDISSTPEDPVHVGSIESSFNHSINDIFVREGHAYLATGYTSGELAIVDLSTLDKNDATPTTIKYVNLPGTGREARSLYALGNILYLGRDSSNKNNEHDFYTFRITDLLSMPTPTPLGSVNVNGKNNVAVISVVVQSHLAFLGSTNSTAEFQVWNVSDPSNIVPHGCNTFNFPANPSDLTYSGNYIFMAVESYDMLHVIYDANDNTCH